MGLINGETGRLTDSGLKATSGETELDLALRAGVKRALQSHGIALQRVKEQAVKMMNAFPKSELPTSASLFVALGLDPKTCRHELFSSLLTLLEHAGGASVSRRKIFLG